MKSDIPPARQALLAALGAFAFISLPADAQTQAADMPPRLEKVEELDSSATDPAANQEASSSKPSRREIIEKRERGEVTSIEVRSGEHSYFLDPGDEPGTVVPGDAQSGNTRTPQWKIFEFDWKRPAETNDAGLQSEPAAPPAPVK
ncbi:hypothetical protein Q8A64_00820 [Oxalobacteraceae bacterium R-40]|uniref:DUF2782 domain-containing protein n=1 Tax=Keguizhuia sedimenti TaxID=3064264 RepID=A0ABU1BIW4_9BURK|nr:hypothetical protein [Oxalobacteraceae bacterium R-40]